MIDGGSSTVSEVGKYRIEPFLKSEGVGKLDYVWVSHGDADHVNGIQEMLMRREVGIRINNLVLPPKDFWNKELKMLASTAEKKGVNVLIMKIGQKYQEGDVEIMCLAPEADGAQDEEEPSANENSMVLSLSYKEFDMLFTGDLEGEGEERVTEILEKGQAAGNLPSAYEVLKVGHHGSKNGTGETFLEAVRPEAAFCSAGKKNRYRHPHAETLERLAKWDVSLYNTKDRSAVKLYTDGKKYCILRP